MKKEPILQHMLTQMPVKFEVEHKGPLVLSGAWVEVDVTNGHAMTIERVYIIDDTITVGESDEYEK
jgi:calcineurin-like phosphoesterase